MSETNGHSLIKPNQRINALNAKGEPICGSPKRKKPGQVCQITQLFPNGRCRLHGGKAVSGLASGTYKTGRYSKYMPAALRDRYNELVNDPTLTHLRSEIGIVAAHLEKKIEELGDKQDFDKLQPMLEQLRKMVESENKRIHQLNQTLTTEQAMAFARQLGDAVKRHVTDPKILAAIQSDFNRTLGR